MIARALVLSYVLLGVVAVAAAIGSGQDAAIASAGPEHEQFAGLAGDWEVYVSSPSGTDPAAQPAGSAEARLRLGGRFLEIEAELTSGPLENALYTLAFDTRHGEYAVVFMDNTGTYFVTARGAADEDGNVVTMYGADDDPVMTSMGFEKEFVIEFRFQSANRFYIEIRFIDTRTPARTELPFLTLEFRR